MCRLAPYWHIITADDHTKIGAIQAVTEGVRLLAHRLVWYVDELSMTSKTFDIDKIPEFDIVHEYREDGKVKRTIYKKVWFHAIPKVYTLGHGLLVMDKVEFGYVRFKKI